MKFYRNAQIEEIAEWRVAEFAAVLGRPLVPHIELFGDLVLGLSISWETN
ncbi:MAG: hypothetical protein JO307_07700 [Bryobacterales bacterium]|nr:hypothetical protein [Bryobacterales bacterium]MBV9402058.1 hypothetical protein [Bryobacterales bacterium]